MEATTIQKQFATAIWEVVVPDCYESVDDEFIFGKSTIRAADKRCLGGNELRWPIVGPPLIVCLPFRICEYQPKGYFLIALEA